MGRAAKQKKAAGRGAAADVPAQGRTGKDGLIFMTYSIVTSSKTGNTQAVADAIAAALPPEGCVYRGAPRRRLLTRT